MEIKKCENKAKTDEFLAKNNGLFSQSFEWANILASEKKSVEQLIVTEGEEQLASVMAVYHKVVFGLVYAFLPFGPVFSSNLSFEQKNKVVESLNQYFKTKKVIFWRQENMNDYGRRVKDVNPSTALILDLDKSEKELVDEMEKKTRYEIRQAEKNMVEIKREKDLEKFWVLMQKTAAHDRFSTHPKSHYEKILASHDSVQFIAYHNNQAVASAIFFGFGNTFTYLFAATDRSFGKLSSAYLIQLEAIRYALAKGFKKYDFFGIAPNISSTENNYEYDREHPYAGFTKFKIGFGGKVMQRPGTFDVVVDPVKYRIYMLLRWLRRLF